jgi:hypothetical protein
VSLVLARCASAMSCARDTVRPATNDPGARPCPSRPPCRLDLGGHVSLGRAVSISLRQANGSGGGTASMINAIDKTTTIAVANPPRVSVG